jgi:hypothetical protein
MSRTLEPRDRAWTHVRRAPAQPAASVPVVPRRPPKSQFGKVATLSEGRAVPRAYCVT